MSEATTHEANGAAIPSDVLAYCRQRQLLPLLDIALDLAKQCFLPPALEVRMECDPESGDPWVVVQLQVTGDADQRRDAYRDYGRQWLRWAPGPERFAIRLAYGLAWARV